MSILCVFFFKQKTAYEMRISDWSSDVCASDLIRQQKDGERRLSRRPCRDLHRRLAHDRVAHRVPIPLREQRRAEQQDERRPAQPAPPWGGTQSLRSRSEEHPSELQSIMRISYAVFCLKK